MHDGLRLHQVRVYTVTWNVTPLLAVEKDVCKIDGAINSFDGSSPLEDLQHVCGQLERSRTLLHSMSPDYTAKQHIGAMPCCLCDDVRTRCVSSD